MTGKQVTKERSVLDGMDSFQSRNYFIKECMMPSSCFYTFHHLAALQYRNGFQEPYAIYHPPPPLDTQANPSNLPALGASREHATIAIYRNGCSCTNTLPSCARGLLSGTSKHAVGLQGEHIPSSLLLLLLLSSSSYSPPPSTAGDACCCFCNMRTCCRVRSN